MSTAVENHVEVLMPQMGVSVSEGTVSRWLEAEGEGVARDEPLLEISTDKVDTEIPSPAEGAVASLLVNEGETVAVGTVIALVAPSGASHVAVQPADPEGAHDERAQAEAAPERHRRFVPPVVARIAKEHEVDLASLAGSGAGGRITKKDILAHIAERGSAAAERESAAASHPPASEHGAPDLVLAEGAADLVPPDAAGELSEALPAMRRSIAEHMRRSLDTSAHVTTVFAVDMHHVVRARADLKASYENAGVNLTYLAFVASATIESLRDWPWLNAEIRGDRVITRSFVNLGIAVALDGGKGLIVPVIKGAEQLNLLAQAIASLAERARNKRLSPEDVQDGTFTITNPGGYGAIVGTPVINQPQVAILDMEVLVKRPVVLPSSDGSDPIAVRPMMNLCLSFDHRLIDGAYAAQFMRQVRERLQGWDARG